jgi:predicted dehydrogenase
MTVRAAVVGCGFQGRLHLDCLRSIEGVDVVGVCDRDLTRARAAAAEHGLESAYGSHLDLLDAEDVDLLTVCTMPDTHCEIVVAGLERGANVLCEKPMAADLADAVTMATAARASGRQLSIGFNLRHTSAARSVREFVESGRLGEPICARGAMLETEVPWWGPHQTKAVSGGGAIAATAVHMLDLLMWLAGNPRPITASASAARLYPRKRGSGVPAAREREPYDVEDLAFGHVRFASGFWLAIEGAWTWDRPGSECAFDLVGDRAHAAAGPLGFWEERDGVPARVAEDAAGEFEFEASVRRELEDMVGAVRDRRPALATAEQALDVQAVVDALYRSAKIGREVEVADVREAVAIG